MRLNIWPGTWTINVDPDILVVDEVLAVGDAEFQEKCFQKFRDLKAEGKTSLSCHLAASLARAGKSVLLVDGDLRIPSAHTLFGLPSWPGLSEVLRGDLSPVEAILPEEGATGWSDTWMVSADTEHPNCAYAWMNHIISPKANAAVAVYADTGPVAGVSLRGNVMGGGRYALHIGTGVRDVTVRGNRFSRQVSP